MKLPRLTKLQIKVIAGILLLVVTLSVFFAKQSHGGEWVSQDSADSATTIEQVEEADPNLEKEEDPEEDSNTEQTVTVDVSGAVSRPKVYVLPLNSRIYQAIEAAGGTTELADTRTINLAAKLIDGTKLYIPTRDEMEAMEIQENQTVETSSLTYAYEQNSGMTNHSNGKINLNTATMDQLQELPGVGPSTAQKIIAYREENGSFHTIEELKEVNGIGDKTYEKMKDLICI